MKKKTVYCNPITERLQLPAENVLNPSTWNPDLGHGDNMSVIEGDPEGDGHGAKANDPYAFLDIELDSDLWRDDSEGIWD